MRKLAAILEHETDDLATLITLEMGKPLEASRFEILKWLTHAATTQTTPRAS